MVWAFLMVQIFMNILIDEKVFIRIGNHIFSITEEMKSISARFSDEFLKENVVVFDGGIRREATAKTKIQVPGLYCLRIDGGALEICTPPSKDMGLMYHDVHDNQPQFVLRDEGTPFTCRQYLFLSYPVVFYA